MKEMEMVDCPFCGSAELSADRLFGAAFVRCHQCGAEGPMADTVEEAVEKWNASKNRKTDEVAA